MLRARLKLVLRARLKLVLLANAVAPFVHIVCGVTNTATPFVHTYVCPPDTWATPYVHATIPVKEEGDRTEDLTQAVITDVEKKKQAGNEGTLACNVIVPEGDEGEYVGYQSYDLEVVPLKEEGSDTNFVIVMDDTNKRAMYVRKRSYRMKEHHSLASRAYQ